MSLTPVTRNFASVTRRVFRDRVVFSGGASLRFASSKCFRVGDAMTQRRENVRVCPALTDGVSHYSRRSVLRATPLCTVHCVCSYPFRVSYTLFVHCTMYIYQFDSSECCGAAHFFGSSGSSGLRSRLRLSY